MHLLIIGASGMAGHLITTYFREKNYTVSTLSGSHPFDSDTILIDVCNIDNLKTYLDNHSFDAVINCSGILIQGSENHKARAIMVNAHLPHYLEEYYRLSSTRIIHLSTDCVFSGTNGPYQENSPCDGSLFYDRSKALGEINTSKDLTFRMSIIGPDLSPNGVGLLNWFLQQHGILTGYTNVFWNGITTLELAKAIEAALEQHLTGLYHLVPSENISKHDLLLLFNQILKSNKLTILPKEVTPINKTLINTRTDFNYTIPSYTSMLLDVREWILQHPQLYPHYSLS